MPFFAALHNKFLTRAGRGSHSRARKGTSLRIVIVDDSGLRATVLEEGLREAGYDDIHLVPPQGAFVVRIERIAPDVVLMDLGSPSRDTLEEMLAVSRALAKPIAMFVDQSDEHMIGAAIDAGVSAYVVDGLRKIGSSRSSTSPSAASTPSRGCRPNWTRPRPRSPNARRSTAPRRS